VAKEVYFIQWQYRRIQSEAKELFLTLHSRDERRSPNHSNPRKVKNPWPKKPKINAVQASHLDRIARGCPAAPSPREGGEVYASKTAFPKERRSIERTSQSLSGRSRSEDPDPQVMTGNDRVSQQLSPACQ
jgi:hypothetical protein